MCLLAIAVVCSLLLMCGCSNRSQTGIQTQRDSFASISDRQGDASEGSDVFASASSSASFDTSDEPHGEVSTAEQIRASMSLTEDYREGFTHGPKGAEYQKYIVLHDTESESAASDVIEYWDGNGNLVAAHFVVNIDGSIVQCVPLDVIAHHAGFGDAGNNELYGVTDESRDDKAGTQPIGDAYPDYGMNSYSIGIEMVHVGGSGWYPEEQLEALDRLIAYIDAYYGFESQIIDHKAWRSTNSDTSAEFAAYLANYQDHRSYRDAALR